MAIYAVQYIYSGEKEQMDVIRPDHRAYLRGLLESGILLASGPYSDRNAALLIFRTEGPQDVARLLDADPFEIAGYVGERIIEEWNPVMGPWEAK